ncbi:hypothetical protein BD324DRAFT_654261 [Kockovaella imperatae]|uniref:receptor protein-tyrosine kinase n=1 Tax=Kockovaella imperatae TaxID=4999 RepID=A0A1Y1U5K9_9TREE|nr:hypothetical protein BD324DRAFT_654261 [Kockovaella imperatae]ORX33313.1 hypothetical protein BD324DRAFT_654261 [Kockovaella imperatae]
MPVQPKPLSLQRQLPAPGTYYISAYGASGGPGQVQALPRYKEPRHGGLGAMINGIFYSKKGYGLTVAVGQHGGSFTSGSFANHLSYSPEPNDYKHGYYGSSRLTMIPTGGLDKGMR